VPASGAVAGAGCLGVRAFALPRSQADLPPLTPPPCARAHPAAAPSVLHPYLEGLFFDIVYNRGHGGDVVAALNYYANAELARFPTDAHAAAEPLEYLGRLYPTFALFRAPLYRELLLSVATHHTMRDLVHYRPVSALRWLRWAEARQPTIGVRRARGLQHQGMGCAGREHTRVAMGSHHGAGPRAASPRTPARPVPPTPIRPGAPAKAPLPNPTLPPDDPHPCSPPTRRGPQQDAKFRSLREFAEAMDGGQPLAALAAAASSSNAGQHAWLARGDRVEELRHAGLREMGRPGDRVPLPEASRKLGFLCGADDPRLLLPVGHRNIVVPRQVGEHVRGEGRGVGALLGWGE
jgi:hypothetical protein